ncbi:MAG: 4-alpha-glucanotransferase, partial [Bacteroidales bacterium]|nr:4-alpha-glucanotransferase [Bacteroidales bacterium]
MDLPRSSGVLLHITSLPGKYGCGTLGPEAKNFANNLKKGGFTYWQILPTGPVSPGLAYSPYSSTSTFAGNYLMISPELICQEDWFKGVEPEKVPEN